MIYHLMWSEIKPVWWIIINLCCQSVQFLKCRDCVSKESVHKLMLITLGRVFSFPGKNTICLFFNNCILFKGWTKLKWFQDFKNVCIYNLHTNLKEESPWKFLLILNKDRQDLCAQTHTRACILSPLETANGRLYRATAVSFPPLQSVFITNNSLLPDSIYGQCLNEAVPALSILMQHQPLSFTVAPSGKWAAKAMLVSAKHLHFMTLRALF